MNNYPHSNAYANHPEYDNMSGHVTHQGSIVGMTNDGWKVKRTVTYISLGRADYGDAAEPDVMIDALEPLPHVRSRPRRKPKKQVRVNVLQERITVVMQRDGSTTMPLLAEELGVPIQTIQKHLHGREGVVYCRMGRKVRAVLWGLLLDEGGHDDDTD